MSQEINRVFTKYKVNFLNREDEMRAFLLRHFEIIFERHIVENVERIDESERIEVAGLYNELSAWRNIRDITLSICLLDRGAQKRYDYKIYFKGEITDYGIEKTEGERSKLSTGFEEVEEEEAPIEEKKDFKEFTAEEKEEYKKQKEQEKVEVEENLQNFLEKQTIKDVVELIDKSPQIPSELSPENAAESEDSEDEESTEDVDEFKRIHGYSIRNYLLVLSQARNRQDSNFVGIINSFWGWKKQKINVSKNPDKSQPYSYKILVPVFAGGNLKGFKLGSVFDISQTNKYEEYLNLKEEEEKETIWKDEIDYDRAIEFVKSNFPAIKIEEDVKKGEERGSYDREDKIITIHQNTSHTVFHELGKHISLSELDVIENVEEGSMKEEILAEITCYLVMKKFEKADEYKINYDFAYSNCWAFDILEEFKFREFERTYEAIMDYVKSIEEEA